MRGDGLRVAEHTLKSPSIYSSFTSPLLHASQLSHFFCLLFCLLLHIFFSSSLYFPSSPSSFPLSFSILTPFLFISHSSPNPVFHSSLSLFPSAFSPVFSPYAVHLLHFLFSMLGTEGGIESSCCQATRLTNKV